MCLPVRFFGVRAAVWTIKGSFHVFRPVKPVAVLACIKLAQDGRVIDRCIDAQDEVGCTIDDTQRYPNDTITLTGPASDQNSVSQEPVQAHKLQ